VQCLPRDIDGSRATRSMARLDVRFSCDIRNTMAVIHRWGNPVDCVAETVTRIITWLLDYKDIDNAGSGI